MSISAFCSTSQDLRVVFVHVCTSDAYRVVKKDAVEGSVCKKVSTQCDASDAMSSTL